MNNLKKLGLKLLASTLFVLPLFTFVSSANAVKVDPPYFPNNIGCYGNQTGGKVDCILPDQQGTSYWHLSRIGYNSGSGADFWICNALSGYTTPTVNGKSYSGCVHKNLGPGWSTVFYNPWSGTTPVDIFINVHNNYQTTNFNFY